MWQGISRAIEWNTNQRRLDREEGRTDQRLGLLREQVGMQRTDSELRNTILKAEHERSGLKFDMDREDRNRKHTAEDERLSMDREVFQRKMDEFDANLKERMAKLTAEEQDRAGNQRKEGVTRVLQEIHLQGRLSPEGIAEFNRHGKTRIKEAHANPDGGQTWVMEDGSTTTIAPDRAAMFGGWAPKDGGTPERTRTAATIQSYMEQLKKDEDHYQARIEALKAAHADKRTRREDKAAIAEQLREAQEAAAAIRNRIGAYATQHDSLMLAGPGGLQHVPGNALPPGGQVQGPAGAGPGTPAPGGIAGPAPTTMATADRALTELERQYDDNTQNAIDQARMGREERNGGLTKKTWGEHFMPYGPEGPQNLGEAVAWPIAVGASMSQTPMQKLQQMLNSDLGKEIRSLPRHAMIETARLAYNSLPGKKMNRDEFTKVFDAVDQQLYQSAAKLIRPYNPAAGLMNHQ